MSRIWCLLCVGLLALQPLLGEDVIARRRAFRAAVEKNPASVKSYLRDSDPEIRRYALYLCIEKSPEASIPALKSAIRDSDVQVRLTAASAMVSLVAKFPELRSVLEECAKKDSSNEVRQLAARATWPFHREIKLLREDKSWDHDVTVAKSIPLPEEGWRFAVDEKQMGHWNKWFDPKFDDSKWKLLKIGNWEDQGFRDYDGVAWYRIHFKMPAKMDSNAVEICFGAVDESAWVWLNGVYLGAHDLGQAGWNSPFAVDCRKEINWGGDNVLVVRVLDTAAAGGIWKPVRVDVLK